MNGKIQHMMQMIVKKIWTIFLLMVVQVLGVQAMAKDASHGITDGMHLMDRNIFAHFRDSAWYYLLNDEQIDQLANSRTWRRLLFFPDTQKQNQKSKIEEPSFFLAKNGRTDPKAELMAMFLAMVEDDSDSICRFVARVHFLESYLQNQGINKKSSLHHCDEFIAWQEKIGQNQLSLVFAEEDPNNIAASFAHVFLRTDHNHQADHLATAINYTVAFDANNPVSTAVKSIVGQQDALLEVLPFSKKQHDYLHLAGRDLWQYQLNLNQAQIAQIIRHLWEIKQLKRPYFFTHENCATEIVRLIDVVRPDLQLSKKVGSVVIPLQIVHLLQEQGMITQSLHFPSQKTKIQSTQDLSKITNQQIDHKNPVYASGVHRVGVGVQIKDSTNQSFLLNINPAYRDFLDNPAGVRDFFELQLMSLQANLTQDGMNIQQATIFQMTNLDADKPNLSEHKKTNFNKAKSQHLSVGLRRIYDISNQENQEHLVFDLQAQRGYSWKMNLKKINKHQGICYTMAGGGVQIGRINQGYRGNMVATLGCVQYHWDNMRTVASIDLPIYFHPDKSKNSRSFYWQPSLNLGMQLDVSRDSAIRLNIKSQKLYQSYGTKTELSYMRYF